MQGHLEFSVSHLPIRSHDCEVVEKQDEVFICGCVGACEVWNWVEVIENMKDMTP
jgi:hypothetical protein